MPFPANQVISYFHVFISLVKATYFPGCHLRNSFTLTLNLELNISVIASACQVPSFQPCKLCATTIKLQEEWRILWTSCRIFTWFTRAFLSSYNNNYHQCAY